MKFQKYLVLIPSLIFVLVLATTNPASAGTTAGITAIAVQPGSALSFDEIKQRGLSNATYPHSDYYVAEYLYQNPDTCLWSVDENKKTVSTVSVPIAPESAGKLPAPSGGDDTQNIKRVIDANSGGAINGFGKTYKVNNLQITKPIDIFNMKMVPADSATQIVVVKAKNVRIFNSPIDGKNSKTLTAGYYVTNGSDNFTLINSGLSNVYHTNNASMSGVRIRAADDFYIACNKFVDLVNNTNDKSKTARSNAIWIQGDKKLAKAANTTSGGYIVNNYAENFQSNGKLNDAEFFTTQSFEKTNPAKPVKIFANRGYDAGKRLVKFQEDDGLVLSNYYNWREKQGPLGPRSLLSVVTVHFSNNVIARNNRVKVAADGRFDYIMIADINAGSHRMDNLHFDNNDVEITEKLSSSSKNNPKLIVFRARREPADSTSKEATNSTAINNYFYGKGLVHYYFWFGPGYRNDGAAVPHTGNVFDIPATKGVYQK